MKPKTSSKKERSEDVGDVRIVENELNAIEDILVAWNLCDVHKRDVMVLDEETLNRVQFNCPDCREVQEKLKKMAMRHLRKCWNALGDEPHGWIRRGGNLHDKEKMGVI